MNDNNVTVQSYDDNIRAYIDGSPQVVEGNIKEWIDEQFSQVPQDAKILEIGSGTGKDATYIESKGFTVQRTDASQGFINLLKSQGEDASLLNVLTDAINGKYDVVFADAVFLHFTEDQLRSVIKKVNDVLSAGGQLLFTLKEGDGEEVTDRKLGGNRYFKYWREADIKELLNDAGFKSTIEKVEDYRKGRPGWLFVSTIKEQV